MARIKKSKKPDEQANVHDDLKGLDLKVNQFGEVIGNKNIEEINQFLNKNVNDKKLDDRVGDYGDDNPLDDYDPDESAKDDDEIPQ